MSILTKKIILVVESFLGGLSGAIVSFALAWAASQYGASALGGTLIAGMIPSLLLTFVGGVVADRYDPRHTLFAGSLLGAAVLVMAAIAYHFFPGAAVFMFANFAISAVGAVFNASAYVIPAALFPEKELVRINAGMSLADDAAYLVGPLLGAFIFQSTGVSGTLFFAAAVGAASGILLVGLPPVPRSEAEEALDIEFAGAGFAYIAKATSILFLVLFFASINIFSAAFQVATPIFAAALGGAQAYALLLSGMNFGMTASNLALSAVPLRSNTKLIFSTGLVQGLALAALSRSRSLPMAAASGALNDAMANVSSTVFVAYLQSKVPEAIVGRVFAAVNTLAMVLTPLGFLIAPVLIERLGAADAILVLGTGTVSAVVVVWIIGSLYAHTSE